MIGILSIISIMGCPIKRIIGFSCPTCGMSRAIISLLKLDFIKYCYYNLMALPVLVSLFIILMSGSKKYITISYIILILNFIYYFIRVYVLHISI